MSASLLLCGIRSVRFPFRQFSSNPVKSLLLEDSNATYDLAIVKESLRCLTEREGDVQLQHSIASQFDPNQLRTWSRSANEDLARSSRKLMAMLGVVDFNARKGNYGIRILSIDGGGTKALIAIEILKRLEHHTQRRIHELFDFIGGASTGAILAFSLGIHHWTLEAIEQLYVELGREIFAMQKVKGGGRMLRGYSYYDTNLLEEILRSNFGSAQMIDSAQDATVPKIFANSSLAKDLQPVPYLFRNYNLPAHVSSAYPGSSKFMQWQALRATTAAPGYFDEIILDKHVHHDGGILCNNPTAIAIHEAKRIWGKSCPIECVLSLGTGKLQQIAAPGAEKASWLGIAQMVINSATDSKGVHRIMQDLLPQNVYFRFNPFVTEPYLNEYRHSPEKLAQYQQDARRFLSANGEEEVKRAAAVLAQQRDLLNRWKDWLRVHPVVRALIDSFFLPIWRLFSTRPTS